MSPAGRDISRAASVHATSSHGENEARPGQVRPVSHAVRTTPERHRLARKKKLKLSVSAPLALRDSNGVSAAGCQSSMIDGSLQGAPIDEINHKVAAMLAATAALKPPPSQIKHAPVTRTHAKSSKAMNKVSHAWGRFHSKSPERADESCQQASQTGEDGHGPSRSTEPGLDQNVTTQTLSTIKIRLNEGDNLNKRKVQRIVGGHVVRKPVADEGRSIRCGRIGDDPFIEPSHLILFPMAPFQQSQHDAKAREANLEPFQDPFLSEGRFEQDLEDRILSSLPTGSSTPRIQVQTVSAPSNESLCRRVDIQYTSKRDVSESPTPRREKTAAMATGRMPATPLDAEDAGEATSASVEMCGRGATAKRSRMSIWDRKLAKKHPSPSKKALENLEAAFRLYSHLQASGTGQDELDELVRSQEPGGSALGALDSNRLLSSDTTASGLKNATPGGGRRSYRPGCGESSDVRCARPYRPRGPHADDVDELQ